MTTETVRKELLKMHDNERRAIRCTIAHGLTEEANKLTTVIDTAIDKLVEKNNHMNDQIRVTDKKLAAMRTDREKMLDEAKLNTMSRNYSCSVTELHPTLVEFDAESDAIRKDILLMV